MSCEYVCMCNSVAMHGEKEELEDEPCEQSGTTAQACNNRVIVAVGNRVVSGVTDTQ